MHCEKWCSTELAAAAVRVARIAFFHPLAVHSAFETAFREVFECMDPKPHGENVSRAASLLLVPATPLAAWHRAAQLLGLETFRKLGWGR